MYSVIVFTLGRRASANTGCWNDMRLFRILITVLTKRLFFCLPRVACNKTVVKSNCFLDTFSVLM